MVRRPDLRVDPNSPGRVQPGRTRDHVLKETGVAVTEGTCLVTIAILSKDVELTTLVTSPNTVLS